MASDLDLCCDFIHHLQLERGCVTVYLRSGGQLYTAEMEQQFHIVDQHIERLLQIPRNKGQKIEDLIQVLLGLPAKRKYIIARMVESGDIIRFYTKEIINPALEIIQEMAFSDSRSNPARVSTFMNFMHWKEKVGLERALGTDITKDEWPVDSTLFSRLQYLVREQQAYERIFMTLADAEQVALYQEKQKNDPALQKIATINQAILSGQLSPILQKMTVTEWFMLLTAKMDFLHQIGHVMLDNLSEQHQTLPEAIDPKDITAAEPIAHDLQKYMNLIESLPLFAGLSANVLQTILRNARIIDSAKNKILFMQDESANRFYIVLQGWVKVFKVNANGEEAVMQIVTTGQSLLESVLFNNTTYPVSAQAVSPAVLLSVPAGILRDMLKTHKDLAMNMLSVMAERSQQWISHFEQLNLKTATQRIGWFLLKLFLENQTAGGTLKLPYDKALIAAYLGMKPETLSRALQTLKEQGIDIDRNVIMLKDVFALCDYCDPSLMALCSKQGTAECPNPDCM